MGKWVSFAVAAISLTVITAGGCVVSQKKFDAEHQKAARLQQNLDKATASLKAAEDKLCELSKKNEADLALAKESSAAELQKQTEALQATIQDMKVALAKGEQTSKQHAAALADKAREAAEQSKEINILKTQLTAAQEEVLRLTEELKASKKAAPPAGPGPQ